MSAAAVEPEPEPEPESELQPEFGEMVHNPALESAREEEGNPALRTRELEENGSALSLASTESEEDVLIQRLGGFGSLMQQQAKRLHKTGALLTGAAPVVDFKSDEFHDEDLQGGHDYLRHYEKDHMGMSHGGDTSVLGKFKTEEERHERLIALIGMATGDSLDANGNHIQEEDEDEYSWDIEEELFKYATIEGMTGKSLRLFAADHPVRVRASEIVNSQLFEYSIVITVLVMMAGLALDSPMRRHTGDNWNAFNDYLEILALVVFTAEAGLRIIAQGLLLGRSTYLHSGWNLMDFCIVMSAWAVFVLRRIDEDEYHEQIEILVTMRLIRPIHTLRFFKGVKTLLAALSFSGPQMATVTMLMSIFFVIFGSFGIELWQGTVSRTCDPGYNDLPIADISPLGTAFSWDAVEDVHREKLIPVGVGVEGGCPKTMQAACSAAKESYTNESAGFPNAPGTCYAVPDQYRETGDWMNAAQTFGFDNMKQAMVTLFIMTTLDEWPLIQRRIELSDCDVCSHLWPVMLVMVILLALLGANLFIAVLTFSYSQVLNRQDLAKKRLGDLAKTQDGPTAIRHMEGEMKTVAMHQLLGQHDIGLKFGSGQHEGEVIQGHIMDQTEDGNADAIDLTGDGQSNLQVVGAEDTTGDGIQDTLLVQDVGSSTIAKLSVVRDNPRAFPHIKGISEPCRKLVLDKGFDQFIGVVILCNAVVMASSTYPERSWQPHLDMLDYVFILIYVSEVILKILGLGLKPYFAVPFHDLDFIVVLASIVSLMYPHYKGATASRMIRLVLRVIRMLRLLKLVSNVDTVVYLIKALTTSGGAVLNITFLIFFVVILVATICMHVFGDCTNNPAEAIAVGRLSRSNFYSFGAAFLTNIQLLTGEDWAPVMFQYTEACGTFAVPFFVAFMVIYNFMLMNLFTAIILQNFSISEHEKMAHQKKAYHDKRGQQAVEDDMAILEWLADAAEGDDRASKAIQAAMAGMQTGAEASSKCVEKVCGCCHHDVHSDEDLAVLIRLQQRDVVLKTKDADMVVRYDDLCKQIETVEAQPGGMEVSAHKIQRDELTKDLKLLEQDHSNTRKEIAGLSIEIEKEKQRLEDIGRDLKHLERSQETGHRTYSCCCLRQNNRLRHFCHDVTNAWSFEALIFAAILASSICLAYHPLREPDEVIKLGHACTVLFILECVMRVIDMNFLNYLSHGWNALDFFIVMAAVAEYIIEHFAMSGYIDLSMLKIFRMLRLLRALRAIKHVEQLKVIVDVLVGCIPTVLAALTIVLIIYACFGIMGLSLFGGMFYRCECSPSAEVCDEDLAYTACLQMFYGLDADFQDVVNQTTGLVVAVDAPSANEMPLLPNTERLDPCTHPLWVENNANGLVNISQCCRGDPTKGFRGFAAVQSSVARSLDCKKQIERQVEIVSGGDLVWANPPYNFDAITSAVQTLFYMATTEGWVDIMHSGQDVPLRPGLAPVQDVSWSYCVYFVLFQMIGAAFAMSLFTGVLVNYFAESSGSGILTRKQQEWVHAKLLVLRAHSVTEVPPDNALKKAAHALYTWKLWELVVSVVIIIQVAIIVAVSYPQNAFVVAWEFNLNMACLCFFTFECTLGIVAIGLGPYVRSGWAKFDITVVVLSWMAFVMEHVLETGAIPSVQALRATRIVRILTLFRSSNNLKALFAALVLSLPAVINITLLMLLIFFVFGVLGMHLYNTMPYQDPPAQLNPLENFNSSLSGMKLLFEVATGHDFLNTVHEMQLNADEGKAEFGGAFSFFFVFYIVGCYILINLFVAMLLENVQISLASENSVIQSEHTDAFKKQWDTVVLSGRGKTKLGKPRLNCYDVFDLIMTLDEPLGRVDEISNWQHRLLLEMQVGLKANRRKTYVTFENALMATCVLYLSNACLPYDLQHVRLLDILHQQQETATRIIQCRAIAMFRQRAVPDSIPTLNKDADGNYIRKKLDTDELIEKYKKAVRLFGNVAARNIAVCNRLDGLTNDRIKPRGEKTGEVRVRFDRRPDMSNPHKKDEIVATVLECRDLSKMDLVGENDPYVIVGVNAATHRTKAIPGGGAACTFGEKDQNTLHFHTAATLESVIVRIFDKDAGGASTDDQIGCTEDLAPKFSEMDRDEPLGQWSHEAWFDIRREVHMKDKNVASRTQEDDNLRQMIKLAKERDQQEQTGSRRTLGEGGSPGAAAEPGEQVVVNPLSTLDDNDEFPEQDGTRPEEKANALTRGTRQMQKRITMASMDADFNPRTNFYRVVRTAVVRGMADPTKSPIRGFLRAGDVVMGFQTQYCTMEDQKGAEKGGKSRAITRMRIKRVNAGRLNMQNVLNGWTSLQTWDGDTVLQLFDLFDDDEYGTV